MMRSKILECWSCDNSLDLETGYHLVDGSPTCTEADLWEAIAESEGLDVNEIRDRDMAEFI
jgi:hypothetical protein